MDERDWLILRALYEHKNITKAAQELYMSQPALTNRLKDIEEKFKVKIAMRGRRGVHFTPQGEYLANYADQIILNLRRIKENVLNFDKNIGGTLRIGTSRLAAKYQLPKILRLFRNEYPEVDFKVIATWSRNIPNYLKSEEVHIGIFRGEQYWPDEKHLLSEEKICIASIELNSRICLIFRVSILRQIVCFKSRSIIGGKETILSPLKSAWKLIRLTLVRRWLSMAWDMRFSRISLFKE